MTLIIKIFRIQSRQLNRTYSGGSPGLVVMGDDSCSKGRGFADFENVRISVTRFGEISPLCHTVKKLWPFWKGSFSIRPNFEIILANFICHWAMFHRCKWSKTKQIVELSGHTGENVDFWMRCHLELRDDRHLMTWDSDQMLLNPHLVFDKWIY